MDSTLPVMSLMGWETKDWVKIRLLVLPKELLICLGDFEWLDIQVL